MPEVKPRARVGVFLWIGVGSLFGGILGALLTNFPGIGFLGLGLAALALIGDSIARGNVRGIPLTRPKAIITLLILAAGGVLFLRCFFDLLFK